MKKSMYYADSDTVHCVVVEKLNFPKYSFFFCVCPQNLFKSI